MKKPPYKKIKPFMQVTELNSADGENFKHVATAWMNLTIAHAELAIAHAPNEELREKAVETMRKARVGIDNIAKLDNPTEVINMAISYIDTKDQRLVASIEGMLAHMFSDETMFELDRAITQDKSINSN